MATSTSYSFSYQNAGLLRYFNMEEGEGYFIHNLFDEGGGPRGAAPRPEGLICAGVPCPEGLICAGVPWLCALRPAGLICAGVPWPKGLICAG
eukprot:5619506-Pyramimonas_sp.AAC.1